MYAILQHGGHQYRVSPGDRLVIDRLTAEVGDVVALEPVLTVSDGADTTVGTPVVAGARVAAVVVGHSQGRKIRVFKYKAKKRFRRTQGHRSQLTELRIEAVLAQGEALPKAPPAKARKAEPAEKPEKVEKPAARAARAAKATGTAAVVEAPAAETTPAEKTPARKSRPAAAAAAPATVEAEAASPKPKRAARAPKPAAAPDEEGNAPEADTDAPTETDG
jgi:large subunit ribosomal protein L21